MYEMKRLFQLIILFLNANIYQNPALTAAYGWKTAPSQTLVDNLTLTGQNLTWNYSNNNVRYSIYAVPKTNDFFTSSKYLLGIAYLKTYTLPSGISTSTHKIAVAVYDR